MPDAHAAAVEAMAVAIMRPDVRDFYDERPDPGAAAYYRERATDALAALVRSEAVRAALVEALGAHLAERISYHGPYGATSEEQWQMDTEKQFVRELQDGRLLDAILAALAPPEAT